MIAHPPAAYGHSLCVLVDSMHLHTRTDMAETIEAINACKDANVKLMTALQRRFDPNFARVKKAIVDGEVGDVVQVKLCSRDPSPPPFQYVKGGGGIFKDMAVHDLDMSRFLMGTEPKVGHFFSVCMDIGWVM